MSARALYGLAFLFALLCGLAGFIGVTMHVGVPSTAGPMFDPAGTGEVANLQLMQIQLGVIIISTALGICSVVLLGFGALVQIFGSRAHAEQLARDGKPSTKQICPCCDEAISANASVCPWCGCDAAEEQSAVEAP